MKKVDVIPVVIGALRTVTKNIDKWLKQLGLDLTVEMLQRPCLLGTARIIRKVLGIKERSNVKMPKNTECGPLSWQMNQEIRSLLLKRHIIIQFIFSLRL